MEKRNQKTHQEQRKKVRKIKKKSLKKIKKKRNCCQKIKFHAY